MTRIKVYPWATDTAGCFYQRLQLPLNALEAKYPDEFEVCWSCEPKSDDGPAVVLGQRITGSGDQPDLRWISYCEDPGILAVYEIDDDIIDLDPENTVPYRIFTPNRAGTLANIAAADRLIASTVNLAAKIAKTTGRWWGEWVDVAPNCVADWSVVERDTGKRDGRITVGWAGSMFHQQDFSPELVEQLRRVRDENHDVAWVTIGHNYLGWGSSFGFDTIPRYHNRLAMLDIGIVPVARTPFNASKSWIKALDYMAHGVVPIVEDWGQYADLLAGPRTGHEVASPDLWFEALGEAIVTLRQGKFDHAAIADRARQFQISQHVDIWADVFRRAADL